MTNNLGNQAQTGILIADSQVRSPSFSQPYYAANTSLTPSATSLIVPYITGINKYIGYFALTSGSTAVRLLVVSGVPANFNATYSYVGSVVAVPSTQFTTPPQIRVTQYEIDLSGVTNIAVYPTYSVAPVFSGTAYIKIVLQFSLD